LVAKVPLVKTQRFSSLKSLRDNRADDGKKYWVDPRKDRDKDNLEVKVELTKMAYGDFKRIIEEELKKAPDGLTWTQIRERRPELYQKFPANQWVRQMEKDIGLTRLKKAGKTIWSLK